jgi:SAM-dependent methyltransferase
MSKPQPTENRRLSRVEDWDARIGSTASGKSRAWYRLRDLIPHGVRQWLREVRKPHAFRCLMSGILPGVLSGKEGTAERKIIEIGSAPGHYGLAFLREFGLQPYGIEYSPKRAEIQRQLWAAHGLPEEHILCGDFFDDAIVAPLRGQFDVAISFGFIEHFEDPALAVQRHLDLLKPGGVLIIMVPNIGHGTFNGWRCRHLNPEVYGIHNIETCTESVFRKLFQTEGLDLTYCGALGGYTSDFMPDRRWISRAVAWVSRGMSPGFRIFNNVLFGVRPVRWPRLSSSLMCVARKID